MSFISANSERSLTAQPEEEIRVLGQTGQTVIYMFPNGRGVAEREKPDFDALPVDGNPSTVISDQLLDDLIAAGKLSEAQKAVALHDREITGMSIEEVLIARGWL